MIKSTESYLIEDIENHPNRKTIVSKPDKEVVPQFRYGQGKSLALGEDIKIENILGEHNEYKRHSIAAALNKTNSSEKSNNRRITIDKFMNSNVDNESNKEKFIVNIVRRKHLQIIEESENKQSDTTSEV